MDDAATCLRRLAATARGFLEPYWRARLQARGISGATVSLGACQISTDFLLLVLQDEGIAARAVMGAPAVAGYGFQAPGGWRGHFWVETTAYIVDITADQFGADPVIVAPKPDPRYRSGGWDLADARRLERRRHKARALLARWRVRPATDTGAAHVSRPAQLERTNRCD